MEQKPSTNTEKPLLDKNETITEEKHKISFGRKLCIGRVPIENNTVLENAVKNVSSKNLSISFTHKLGSKLS